MTYIPQKAPQNVPQSAPGTAPDPSPAWPMPKWNNHAALAATVAVALAGSLGLTMVLGRTLSPAAFGFVALVGGVLATARDVTELGSGTVADRKSTRLNSSHG